MAQLFQTSDFLVQLLAFVSLGAVIILLAIPFLSPDPLQKRLKTHIFDRESAKAAKVNRAGLRSEGQPFVRSIVTYFRLTQWLAIDNAAAKLASAGYRGVAAESMFIFFRGAVPIALCLIGFVYLFIINDNDYAFSTRIGVLFGLLYIGMKIPEIYLDKVTQYRRDSIRRAFPDALDLLVICVESGNSIEAAFRRVSDEIGQTSLPLAEELVLTTAELSFLPERRQAYDNLARRVDLDSVRQIVTVLNQADRYGTPLASALRLVAQESRAARMAEAERKAAALPPKLTVPMVLFFLPVLFVVILGPAISQAAKSFF